MILLLSQFISGCGTMRNGRGWGQDITLWPGAKRIGQAAKKAVSNPKTWAPLAGAAFFGVTGLDQEVSQWAYQNTPVFGSTDNALKRSDDLLLASKIIWISTMVITPSGNNLPEIALAKIKGIALEAVAVSATRNLTGVIKKTSKRSRPNGSDDESFPSAHASHSTTYISLAMTNLDVLSIRSGVNTALDIGLFAIASGTAWARVEGRVHYPSDVLFGMALGNFMAVFFTEAFMGFDSESPLKINAVPASDGALLLFSVRF
jgi:membrane-associated phospholipid phosphatase